MIRGSVPVRLLVLIVIAAVTAAACATGAAEATEPAIEPTTPAPTPTAPPETPTSATSFASVADMVEVAMPAVVSIVSGAEGLGILGNITPRGEGAGSGIIFDSSGLIVTNQHVIADSAHIEVTLDDGRAFQAEVVGEDDLTDLAVIRIEAEQLPTLSFANPEGLRVGDPVVAIGNALALEGSATVTAGLVSALNRSISLDGGMPLDDLVQTDAAIYPGNSGGPLLNMRGQVIGINTAIDRQSAGIGFAVGATTITRIVDLLVRDGKVVRGFLGVQLATVNPSLAQQFELGIEEGVLITDVFRGTPAYDAGLRQRDVVTAFNGVAVTTYEDFVHLIRTSPIGDELDLTYVRGGKEFSTTVILTERP